jgi:hypothetical protein
VNLLCTWCGTDEYVEEYDIANDIAYCSGPGHLEPRMFQPKIERALAKANELADLDEGIASELGLYEDLANLLEYGKRLETAVVEYRYGIAHPENYSWMLDRWGHVTQGPRKYSTTAFIGSTLGQLTRMTNVAHKSGPSTAFFSYNSWVGYWTLEPVPSTIVDIGWTQFALDAGIDPNTWPLV